MEETTATTATTDTQAPVEVVRGFLGALERLDVDGALELVDDGISYQNWPFPPARGRRAVEKQLRGLTRSFTGFEARIENIAADGGTVLTERVDVLARGGWRAEFWVCGTFEVRDGKVLVWRDRFDYVDLTVAMLRGAVRAVLARR